MVHWNGYDKDKLRPDAMVDHYVSEVRQFAMYRGAEDITTWDDADKRLGPWRAAFTGDTPGRSSSQLEFFVGRASYRKTGVHFSGSTP